MGADYIPTRDADALAWLMAFRDTLANNEGVYQVNPPDIVAVSEAVNQYAQAHAQISSKATRTPGATAEKDEARNNAEQICRFFAMRTKLNRGISAQSKIDLGIHPPNSSRQRIEAPATSPLLQVIAATPGLHTLRYSDSMTPDSRARPFGADMIEIFMGFASPQLEEKAALKLVKSDECEFYGTFTKNPVTIKHEPKNNGRRVVYFGRWGRANGERGPFSTAACGTVWA